jgi:hypothetical protein
MQLVWCIRSNVESIKTIHFIILLSAHNLSPPSYSYNNMLMFVFFEAAIAARQNLKISEMKLCRFIVIAYQHSPHNTRPVIALSLVFFFLHTSPCKITPVFVESGFVCCLCFVLLAEITVRNFLIHFTIRTFPEIVQMPLKYTQPKGCGYTLRNPEIVAAGLSLRAFFS